MKLMLSTILFFSYSLNSASITNDLQIQDIQNEYENSLKLKTNMLHRLSVFNLITETSNPILYKMIEDLAKVVGINTPNIVTFKGNYLTQKITDIDGSDMKTNAFAVNILGIKLTNSICIGEDLIKELSYNELYAVIAHELGHIKRNHIPKTHLLSFANYVTIKAFQYASIKKIIEFKESLNSRSFFPFQFPKPKSNIMGYDYDTIGLLLLEQLPIYIGKAISLKILQICRQHEYEADEVALKASGNKDDIINALKKIKNLAQHKAEICLLNRLLSTHPTNEQREQHLIEQIQNGLLTQNN